MFDEASYSAWIVPLRTIENSFLKFARSGGLGAEFSGGLVVGRRADLDGVGGTLVMG